MLEYITRKFKIICKKCGGHNVTVDIHTDRHEFDHAVISCVCGHSEELEETR